VAFYQEDGGTTMLEAFYVDIQKYQEYRDPETGKHSDWVGNWLESNIAIPFDINTYACRISCPPNGWNDSILSGNAIESTQTIFILVDFSLIANLTETMFV